jgi:hypothetical protein
MIAGENRKNNTCSNRVATEKTATLKYSTMDG